VKSEIKSERPDTSKKWPAFVGAGLDEGLQFLALVASVVGLFPLGLGGVLRARRIRAMTTNFQFRPL
jgi:hypothetical protein